MWGSPGLAPIMVMNFCLISLTAINMCVIHLVVGQPDEFLLSPNNLDH